MASPQGSDFASSAPRSPVPCASELSSEAGEAQRQETLSSLLTRQITQVLNSPAPAIGGDRTLLKRGIEHSPFIQFLSVRLLRHGLLLQLSAELLRCCVSLGGAGSVDTLGLGSAPRLFGLAAVADLVSLAGSALLALFQVFVADNSQ